MVWMWTRRTSIAFAFYFLPLDASGTTEPVERGEDIKTKRSESDTDSTDPCLYITAVAIRYYCCVKKLVGKQQKSGIGRKRARDQQLQSYDISKIYLSLPN